jgi:hypothetical protein
VTASHHVGDFSGSPSTVSIVADPDRDVQPVAIVSGRSTTPFVVENAHKENT